MYVSTPARLVRIAPALLLALSACARGTPMPVQLKPAVNGSPAPVDRSKRLEELMAAAGELSRRLGSTGRDGNALTMLEALRAVDREAESEALRAAVALEAQRLAAEVGAYAEAHRFADRLEDATAERPETPSLEGYTPAPALAFLGRMAEGAQVVMINEAHHVPQHRAFTLRLLEELRGRGFTHFAAETLSADDTGLNARGYALPSTGPYIAEPLYGDMVRTALRLGYRVVPYEAPRTAPDRENAQAANLVQRILQADPRARILVHAGYNHVNESGLLAGKRPMAVQFREMTGIDPVTVDQTEMTEHGTPEHEHPLYRRLARRAAGGAAVWQAGGAAWTLEPGLRDVTVVHPPSQYERGRPTWLRLGGRRRAYPLPAEVCGTAARCLVRAFAADEGPNAVPVDQLEVVRGAGSRALMLPPGRFNMRVEDASGAHMSTTLVTIGG
jgi:hypothetical protein